MTRTLASLASLLTILTLTGTPLGAAAQDDEAPEDPRWLFHTAEAAFEEHDYERALELFEQAYEVAPHVDVLFNIARVLERLGRFRESAASYRNVADDPNAQEGTREEAARRAEELEGRLAIVSTGEVTTGTVLSVDGVERCTAPCESGEDPGPRVITLVHNGRERTERVELSRGQRLELAAPVFDTTQETPPPNRITEPDEPIAPDESSLLVPALAVGGFALVTGALSVGFGIRASDLHDQYTGGMPTQEALDEGELMVTLTNVSLAVAIGMAVTAGVLALIEAL